MWFGYNIPFEEIFVSDGAKSDVGNIQSIFDLNNKVAVQDPTYPVYVHSNVIAGRTELVQDKGQYSNLVYLPCVPENNFVPDVPKEKVNLLYLCYPNNPTGATITRAELQKFVDWARANKAIIIYDAAYSWFISDSELPRSIYEIEGATECAIEQQSFSKFAGFTGVRLGWLVVPKALITEDSEVGDVHKLWMRRQNTFFNGASNIAQAGGLAALSPDGTKACRELIDYYMENAKIIREGLEKTGLKCYGGEQAPYIWVEIGQDSWAYFDNLLEKFQIVCTPGAGFGPSGQGFVRFSPFGSRENTLEAIHRLQNA